MIIYIIINPFLEPERNNAHSFLKFPSIYLPNEMGLPRYRLAGDTEGSPCPQPGYSGQWWLCFLETLYQDPRISFPEIGIHPLQQIQEAN